MSIISSLDILIDNDPRFVEIKNNPIMKRDLFVAIDRIYTSGIIKDSCLSFLRNQRDIPRYVEIAKKIACCPRSGRHFPRSFEDRTINEQSVRDDLMSFYYELDVITGGRHKFVEKVSKQLENTNFIVGNGRSSVGATYDDKGNIVESHINIYLEPLVNSRTVAMHEEWHAIDEKNFNNLNGKDEQDQFLGEIGTLFIDKLSRDYILKTYADNDELVDKIRRLDLARNDTMIDKARESYLDYLFVQSIVGNREEQMVANQEIVANFGKLWGVGEIKHKIEHLYQVAMGDPDKHFDPLYELRYVVGEAVSKAVYSSQDMTLAEKVDKMATFNENIFHTERLDSSSQTPLDRVTAFLQVDNIESLVDNMSSSLSHKQNQIMD